MLQRAYEEQWPYLKTCCATILVIRLYDLPRERVVMMTFYSSINANLLLTRSTVSFPKSRYVHAHSQSMRLETKGLNYWHLKKEIQS